MQLGGHRDLDIGEAAELVVALEVDHGISRCDRSTCHRGDDIAEEPFALRHAPSQGEGHVVLAAAEEVEDGGNRAPV